MKKQTLVLVAILILATALRFWNLGKVPASTTNDEAAIIYNAYSIAKTGKDIAGIFLPTSINLDNSFSPVYMYIAAPFVGLLGISLSSGRLPFAIMGVLGIYIMYLFVKALTKRESVALASAFIVAVSPWHLALTRMANDAPTALFFSLIGLYIFTSQVRSKRLLWSLPFFFLAFYSYHATKVYLIGQFVILLLAFRKELLNSKKLAIIFITSMVTMLLIFLLFSQKMGITRQSVFIWNHPENAARFVDFERNNNSAPYWMMPIFNNKPLYYLRIIRENFLESFSMNYLFLYGETGGISDIFSVHFRGSFYIIELLFLIFGIVALIRKPTERTGFIIGSLLISTLPSTFTEDKAIVTRNIMMLPFFAIIMGYGVDSCIEFVKACRRPIGIAIISIGASWYLFLILGFLYQYHYRFSIYGAEAWFRSHRDLSEYILANSSAYQNIWVAKTGYMFLLQYGIYGRIDPKNIQRAFAQKWPKTIGNLTLFDDCIDTQETAFDPNLFLPPNTLYIVPPECYPNDIPPEPNTIRQVGEPLRIMRKIYKSTPSNVNDINHLDESTKK